MVRKTTRWEKVIRYRLLMLLGGALVLCFLLFLSIVYLGLRSNLHEDLQNRLRYARHLNDVLIAQRTEVLQASIEPLLKQQDFQKAFLEKDREYLLRLSREVFANIRSVHNITHFYFHNAEGYNFLRVHQPDRFGDRIDRHTMRDSAASLKPSVGLELGPLGTFTLRMVSPWFAEGKLIGFIELGEDFQPIIDDAAVAAEFDVVVLINKRLLDEQGWKAGMKMLGREDDWDLFPDVALVDETRSGLALMLQEAYQPVSLEVSQDISVSMEGREYLGSSLPLKDASDEIVGRWYVLYDISARMDDFRHAMGLVLVLCLSVGMVLIAILNAVLRKIEQQLLEARHGLEQLVADRTDDLQKALVETQVSREQIRVVLKSIQDPIFVVDESDHLWLANRAARDLFRLGDKDLPEVKLEELLQADVYRQLSELRPVDSHMESEIEIEHLQAGKTVSSTFAVQTTSVELGELGYAHIFLFHDMTRTRKMEKLKTEFISNAAHELNTPLASILGYIELLLDPEQKFTEEMRSEFLRTIYRKSNHLNRLLGQILDISRLEAGRPIPLSLRDVPLQNAVHEFFELLPTIHEKHHIEIDLPTEKVVVRVDPEKFQQILENIVSNAIKYSPEGGDVTFRVSFEDHEHLHFVVKDQGIGMSQEELSQAFERFYRVDASDSAIRGVGLGLTITKQLIESHEGRVWIESVPGEGTEVHFVLPGHLVAEGNSTTGA